MLNTLFKPIVVISAIALAYVLSLSTGNAESGKSAQIEIEKVFVSTAYADGGSIVITASTTDNRTVYIFIDKSGKHKDSDDTEIAFINSIDLTKSPNKLNLVLNALETKFKTHFPGKSAAELLEKILDDSTTENDRNIFNLVFLLEQVCAKQVFKDIQTEIVISIDCNFYLKDATN